MIHGDSDGGPWLAWVDAIVLAINDAPCRRVLEGSEEVIQLPHDG
jgi:hypothetical protein